MEERRLHRPPGSGKSRVAVALAQAYKELGALPFARVYETAAAGLAGSSAREPGPENPSMSSRWHGMRLKPRQCAALEARVEAKICHASRLLAMSDKVMYARSPTR